MFVVLWGIFDRSSDNLDGFHRLDDNVDGANRFDLAWPDSPPYSLMTMCLNGNFQGLLSAAIFTHPVLGSSGFHLRLDKPSLKRAIMLLSFLFLFSASTEEIHNRHMSDL